MIQHRSFQFLLLLLLRVAAPAPSASFNNILLIVVDNFRPQFSSYGDSVVITPHLNAFAANGSTLFSNANCQVAWCAPSRNSFLSGRRPSVTRAWNFLDSFREAGPAWVTLPGYFLNAGFYATGTGKVFHPELPANFDYPLSWSDEVFCPEKRGCPNSTMACTLPAGDVDADAAATDELLSRLASRPAGTPFFAAIGFQGPRLPWVFLSDAAAAYPPAAEIPIAVNRTSAALSDLEYFRPTEIDQYSDVRNVTHGAPMADDLQHVVRRAYYATITNADAQIGRVLDFVSAAGLDNNTVIAVVADHGQNLGEHNLWSMMSLMDTSMRVPFILRAPPLAGAPQAPTFEGPVEMVDLYPTLAALAGLPPPPANWSLPGVDLSAALYGGAIAKDAAFSEITRCFNCSLAYNDSSQCTWDAAADGAKYAVPCALASREKFDVMGLSVRTADFRFSTWCSWDGASLTPNTDSCGDEELFDHRNESGQPFFRPEAEAENVVDDPAYADVVADLRARVRAQWSA